MTPLLAQRLRADRSFERLYQRYVGDVYRYSLAVLNNPSDAEDVTQTTFLNAYRAIQSGEHPRTPQHWLIKIAHNVCRQRFRQAARRPEEVMLDDNVGDGTVPDESGPTAEDIRRAMGHLAFNQRAALVMRELEGRSYAEIAEVLGVSVSAVETLIFRARRALREQLEGRLTCAEAERAISKQLDGELARSERGALRAHLRECADCATLARKQRAQRVAIKALGLVPLPQGLTALLGSGSAAAGATAGVTLGAKAAAVIAAGAIATGASVEGAKHAGLLDDPRRDAVPAASEAGARPSSALPVSAAPPATKPPVSVAPIAGTTGPTRARGRAADRAAQPNRGRSVEAHAERDARKAEQADAKAERDARKAEQAQAGADRRTGKTTRKRDRRNVTARERRGGRAALDPGPADAAGGDPPVRDPKPRPEEQGPKESSRDDQGSAGRAEPPGPPLVSQVEKAVDEVAKKLPKNPKN